MTLKGGTASACAACKYQRRKCTPECPLAPYFPSEQTKAFQNAHKLFGVSNIIKILKNLDPIQQAEAMRSIKYQSNVREKFPVFGCLGVIRQLYYQIQLVEEELHAVHAQLEMYRQHHQISSIADDVSQLELGMAPPTNALPLLNQVPQQQYNNNPMAVTLQPVSMHTADGYVSSYLDSKENVVAWVQNPFTANNNGDNGNPMAMQSSDQAITPQTLPVHEQVVQDYDEIHPFFDIIDDRQSYFDYKEAYEQSSCSEESLKDTTQSVERAENELKSAAACFSLTSINGSSLTMS